MKEVSTPYNKKELNIIDIWNILRMRRNIIYSITSIFVLCSFIYITFKNPLPLYKGKVMVEIGTGKHIIDNIKNNFISNLTPIDNVNILKNVISEKYSVLVSSPKWTNTLIVIESIDNDKEYIKKELEDIINFILLRYDEKVKLFDAHTVTKQIDKIKISNNPVNTPNKKGILLVSFILGIIFSILIALFLEFIKEEKSD